MSTECQVSAKRKYLCLHATFKHLEVIKVAFRRSLEPSSGTCYNKIKFRDHVVEALFVWEKYIFFLLLLLGIIFSNISYKSIQFL